MAASVPGRIGIHWLAHMPAESVKQGSTNTKGIPFSRARWRWKGVLVPKMVWAGSQPQEMMSFELR